MSMVNITIDGKPIRGCKAGRHRYSYTLLLKGYQRDRRVQNVSRGDQGREGASGGMCVSGCRGK